MRQSTETLRANSVQELTENILNATEVLVRPENSELYLRGARSYSSLTPEDKFRFQMLIGLFVGRFDTVLEYRERGMVDDAYVAFHSDSMRTIFENPGVSEYRKMSRMFQRAPTRVRVWLDENLAA